MENSITKLFKEWIDVYQKTTEPERKELYHQKMVGFVIGLELSGNNINANECKKMFEKINV